MNWIPAFAGMTDEEKINRGFRAIPPRTAIEMNWIPAFAGMTDEEKINRGFRAIVR
jgi:hypothetical protein